MTNKIVERFGIVAPSYLAILFGTIIGVLLGAFPDSLNLVIGTLLLSIIPGHVFLILWMPKVLENYGKTEGFPFYLFIIPVISISIVSGIGLFLSIIGEFTRENILFTIIFTCVGGIGLVFVIREEAKFLFDNIINFTIAPLSHNPFNFSKDGITYSNALLLVSILILSSAMAQKATVSDEFTEIYITGLNGNIEEISTFKEDSSSSFEVLVGVNHRGNDQTFELEEAIYLIEENSSIDDMEPIFRNVRLVDLIDGGSFQSNFTYDLEDSGSYMVQFNLFKEGFLEAHRTIHFYIDMA